MQNTAQTPQEAALGKFLQNLKEGESPSIPDIFNAGLQAGISLREPAAESSATEKVRISVPEYAMALAQVASLRSEDPFRKVGAVALDKDNRVIGTAYNGLAPGHKAGPDFWNDRDQRQKFMLHAEINLCSLFRRGEAKLIACTTMPCTSCMQTLCAYGIKEIYYCEDYSASKAQEIADLYGITLTQVHSPIQLIG